MALQIFLKGVFYIFQDCLFFFSRKEKFIFFSSILLFAIFILSDFGLTIAFKYFLDSLESVREQSLMIILFYCFLFWISRSSIILRFNLYSKSELLFQKYYFRYIGFHFLSSSYSNYLKNKPAGYTICFDNSVHGLRGALSSFLFGLLPITLRFLFLLPIVFIYTNIEFAIGILILSSLYVFMTFRMTPKVREKEQEWVETSYKNFTGMEEYISNFQTVHLFGALNWVQKKHGNQINLFLSKVRNWLSEYLKVSLVQSFVVSLLVAFSSLYSFFLYDRGEISLPVIVMVNSLVLQVIVPLENFEVNFRDFVSNLIKINLAEDLLSQLKSGTEKHKSLIQKNFHDQKIIEVKHLRFHIAGNTILQGINLAIYKNTIVSITGKSGAGKSTLAKCMSGLFDYEGEIQTEEGVQISYLSQEVEIFDDNIYANVALSDRYKMKEVESALSRSGFRSEELEKIKKRNLGHQGIHISGGQKRRVGIARLLYNDSDVLILDEPSASLDEGNIQTLLEVIENLKKDHTIIIITHNESIIKISDAVFNLEKENCIVFSKRDKI